MSRKLELMREAYNRGILPDQYKPLFEEAMRRGLVPGVEVNQAQPKESGLRLEQPEVDFDDIPGYRETVESTGKAMRNIPSSFMEEAGGVVEAVMSPWETTKNLGKLAVGGVQKGVKALGGDIGDEYIPYADALGDEYANRYGGWDKAKKTFEERPVALLSDLTLPLTFAGSGLTVAGKAGQAGNIASKAGKALNTASKYVDPMTYAALAAKPITAPIKGLAKAVAPSPERLYGSAIKGLGALPHDVQKQIIETGLNERILPTEAGFGKIQDIQRKVGSEVGRLIDERAAAELSGEVPVSINADDILKRAYTHVRDSEKGPYKTKRWGEAAKAARVYHKGNKGPIDTRSAQDLKIGAQDEAKSTYAETGGKPPKDKQLANAIAHETRMDIERVVPQVAPLNARLHQLYPLEGVLEKALGREIGKNLISLPSLVGGVGLDSIPRLTEVGALNIGRLPGVKGRAAFALDALRKLSDNKKFQAFKAAQRPMRAGAYVGNLLDMVAEEDKKKSKKK